MKEFGDWNQVAKAMEATRLQARQAEEYAHANGLIRGSAYNWQEGALKRAEEARSQASERERERAERLDRQRRLERARLQRHEELTRLLGEHLDEFDRLLLAARHWYLGGETDWELWRAVFPEFFEADTTQPALPTKWIARKFAKRARKRGLHPEPKWNNTTGRLEVFGWYFPDLGFSTRGTKIGRYGCRHLELRGLKQMAILLGLSDPSLDLLTMANFENPDEKLGS